MGEIKSIGEIVGDSFKRFELPQSEHTEEEPAKYPLDGMYAVVYHGLAPRFKLKPIEILLVAIIASLSRKTGYCYASNTTLASMTGLTSMAVLTNLQNLEEKELIKRGPNKGRKGTIQYKIGPEVEYWLKNFKRQIRFVEEEKRNKVSSL